MITIYSSRHLGWQDDISINLYKLIVDSSDNLPDSEYYPDTTHRISQGSTAWVVEDSTMYMYNSESEQVIQDIGNAPDYNQLTNKPSINGTTLAGALSLDDIGAASKTTTDSLQEKTVGMTEGGSNHITVGGIRVYVSSTAPTGDIPDGSVGVGW